MKDLPYGDIPINIGLIDSLTVFLEIKKIQILDQKLTKKFVCHFIDVDEVTNEFNFLEFDNVPFPPKAVPYEKNGIKTRFSKVVWRANAKIKHDREFIRVTLTTKMLRHRYFQGINLENLDYVLDIINDSKIIRVTKNVLLEAPCNDIDICINYRSTLEAYKMALFTWKKRVKPTRQRDVILFQPKEMSLSKNYGLQFGQRDKGSITIPFIKFYNKTEELDSNSTEFCNLYIYPQLKYGLDIDNIYRKEITIKNYAMKQSLWKKKLVSYDNKLETLKDILSISKERLKKIADRQLRFYFDKNQITITTDLSPTDTVLSYFMAQLVERGADKYELLGCLPIIEGKVRRSRMKKKIEQLIHTTFSQDYLDDVLKKNSYANEFIRMQKIWED